MIRGLDESRHALYAFELEHLRESRYVITGNPCEDSSLNFITAMFLHARRRLRLHPTIRLAQITLKSERSIPMSNYRPGIQLSSNSNN